MTAEIVAPAHQAAIAAVADRVGIADLGYRLLWAIDARQWNRIADLCDTEISVSWEDPAALPRSFNGRDATMNGMRTLFGTVASHHQATNELIEVNADRAVLHWLVVGRYRASTMRGNDGCMIQAEQRIALNRRPSGWRICSIKHSNYWVEGNPGVLHTVLPPPSKGAPAASFRPTSFDGIEQQGLSALLDRAAIYDVMTRFGRGLDGKDWQLYRSCFGKSLILDFSSTTGEPAREVDADLFVEFAEARQRSHTAFHQYSNFRVDIRGERADCILYMVARHRVSESGHGDPLNVLVGWYENEFVRGPDGWKISVLRAPVHWVEGNALIKDKTDPTVEEISRRLFAKEGLH